MLLLQHFVKGVFYLTLSKTFRQAQGDESNLKFLNDSHACLSITKN
jgi:hypothetical protein